MAHSGSPTLRWMPSLEASEAVLWQCMSTRLVDAVVVSWFIDREIRLLTDGFCVPLGKIL